MTDESTRALLTDLVLPLFGVQQGTPLQQLAEPVKTWVEYAITTVERGEATLDTHIPGGSLSGVRYLDVGSGYGGCLLAAARRDAAEVVGIDVDARLVEISNKLLGAQGIRGRIEVADASAPNLRAKLGQFDVITCSDVVEHVPDVPQLLANLADMLSPTGVLYIAIPNRQSPLWIRSDPHFLSFGIVLLPREDAMDYHLKVIGWDGYDVGDYYDWSYFDALFAANRLIASPSNELPADPAALLRQVEQDFAALENEAAALDTSKIGASLAVKVRAALANVIVSFRAELETAGKSRRGVAALVRDFHWPMWHVLASKRHPSRIAELMGRRQR